MFRHDNGGGERVEPEQSECLLSISYEQAMSRARGEKVQGQGSWELRQKLRQGSQTPTTQVQSLTCSGFDRITFV